MRKAFMTLVFLLYLLPLIQAKSFIVRNVSNEGQTYFIVNGNTGYVGVGLITPLYPLHVSGDVYWTGVLQGGDVPWVRLSNYPSACSSGQAITALGDTPTCTAFLQTESDPKVGTVTNTYVCYGDGSAVQCGDAGITYSTSTDRLTVGALTVDTNTLYVDSSNDRVGIGTTSPNSTLHVVGNINITGAYYGAGTGLTGTATSLTAGDLQCTNCIGGTEIDESSLVPLSSWYNTTAQIQAVLVGGNLTGTVGNANLASNSVNSAKIVDRSISAIDLAPDIGLGWQNLTAYPSACSSGQAITALGDTPTCTAFLQTESDPQVGTVTNTYVCYGDGSAVQCGDAGITYSTSTDRLTVGALTVDTNTLYVDSSNDRVGIGTTSPLAKLHITGTGSLLNVSNSTHSFLFVNGTSGNVGIGTTNPGSYKLYVDGIIYASGSSKKFKENITYLEINTTKIYELKPVSFDFKPEYKHLGEDIGGGRQFGLIAEDTFEVIPELVIRDNNGNVSNVNYEKLSILLLEELKKQHQEIIQLKEEIKYLKEQINKTVK
ncbi:MAG: tail fiber domain-containing protein [Candidatus Aenigmatarchaeota archaeon]